MIAGRITTFIRSAFAGMSDSPAAGLFRPSWLLSYAARKPIDYTLESKAAADGYQFIFALCPASLTQRLPSVPSGFAAVADLCRTDILTLGSISPLMTKWSRNREVEFGSCGRCRPAGRQLSAENSTGSNHSTTTTRGRDAGGRSGVWPNRWSARKRAHDGNQRAIG